MEFLVAFALDVPAGTPKSEISDRENAEAAATAKLADDGHLVRVWRSGARGETTIVGHFRSTDHPVIQSYEPGEDWWYCYLDDLVLQNNGAPSFEYS